MQQIYLEVLGFDRIGFVNDIDKEISKLGSIKRLHFDSDGIKSIGKIEIEMNHPTEILLTKLKLVDGLVEVKILEV